MAPRYRQDCLCFIEFPRHRPFAAPPLRRPHFRFFLRQIVPDSVVILCEKCAMDPAPAKFSYNLVIAKKIAAAHRHRRPTDRFLAWTHNIIQLCRIFLFLLFALYFYSSAKISRHIHM
jgi:hypothetical protein